MKYSWEQHSSENLLIKKCCFLLLNQAPCRNMALITFILGEFLWTYVFPLGKLFIEVGPSFIRRTSQQSFSCPNNFLVSLIINTRFHEGNHLSQEDECWWKIQPSIHNWHYFTNSNANITLVTHLSVVTNIKEYNLCCEKKKNMKG